MCLRITVGSIKGPNWGSLLKNEFLPLLFFCLGRGVVGSHFERHQYDPRDFWAPEISRTLTPFYTEGAAGGALHSQTCA